MPERLEPIGHSFGVAQSWSMFTPFPTREDGWFVIPGNLRDGQTVDLMPVTRNDFSAHPVSWEKPDYVAGMDKNDHWRKYLQSLRSVAYVDQRLHFSRYLCREWNGRHTGSKQLETFQVTYMLEMTQLDGQRAALQKVMLRDHRCV